MQSASVVPDDIIDEAITSEPISSMLGSSIQQEDLMLKSHSLGPTSLQHDNTDAFSTPSVASSMRDDSRPDVQHSIDTSSKAESLQGRAEADYGRHSSLAHDTSSSIREEQQPRVQVHQHELDRYDDTASVADSGADSRGHLSEQPSMSYSDMELPGGAEDQLQAEVRSLMYIAASGRASSSRYDCRVGALCIYYSLIFHVQCFEWMHRY